MCDRCDVKRKGDGPSIETRKGLQTPGNRDGQLTNACVLLH